MGKEFNRPNYLINQNFLLLPMNYFRTRDPVLPYQLGIQLKDFLTKHQVNDYKFVSFDGPHTISPECLDAVEKFLIEIIQDNKK
jgi:hypothetical protein